MYNRLEVASGATSSARAPLAAAFSPACCLSPEGDKCDNRKFQVLADSADNKITDSTTLTAFQGGAVSNFVDGRHL